MEVMAELLGYQITEQLYVGSRTLVYRGLRARDRHPVVIKLLQNSFPSFNELVQFRNQYAIMCCIADATAEDLIPSSIVRPIALEPYQNAYALVMEDFGGISLKQFLQQEGNCGRNPQAVAQFFEIAIQIAEALDELYRHRVIHKDIKPANILINLETNQIKLIDFSIASLLPRETQEIQNPNVLEGTLAYLSPEQTGRMNRGIDYRSDFYSLGITFYELLTEQLPFKSNEPIELVHCHLAKQPPPIHQINPDLPRILSALINKLMAKNAEDRYQSALGLKHDLEICRHQWAETGQIQPFALGSRDVSDRFSIPEKLYGRQAEVEVLLDAFDRVSNGNTELMLVAGSSGIGKTAVVNEVHKPIVKQRGYFIKGKYDQFQRNIPFSAFVQAFRELMGQLLSESDTQISQWKSKILAAVGENGQVLIEVIPELEHIIGQQPAVLELSGSAAQNRFNLLFQQFVWVFTTKEHPLVIFLDDLQWADLASLKLLQLMMMDAGHLLVIAAYRDNEVSLIHPFMLALEEIGKTSTIVNRIRLAPLTLVDLNHWVADTLSCTTNTAQPLTTLIHQKTKGNPFFAAQFLKLLHDEALISFDAEAGHWQCDIAQVRSRSLTEDVVEFMVQQLQKLSIEAQKALRLAACIGNQFDLETLAIVHEKSQLETATDLWETLQEGFIIPVSDIYKFYQSNGTISEADLEIRLDNLSNIQQSERLPRYKFSHDRVQQAAYCLIHPDQKQATHLKIGRLLWGNAAIEAHSEKIFEVVNQLNEGLPLITEPIERQQVARLNLLAGRTAKLSTAYASALNYLALGIELLTEESWQTDYDLTLMLHIEAAEAAYLSARYSMSEQWVNQIEQHTTSILDIAKAYELKIQLYMAQLEMEKAIATGLEALSALGILIASPLHRNHDDLKLPALTELDQIVEMTDPTKLAALRILNAVTTTAYQTQPEVFRWIVLTQLDLCICEGHSASAAFAYIAYAWFCGTIGAADRAYHAGQIAMALSERFNAKELRCSLIQLFECFVRHQKEHIQKTFLPLVESIQIGLEDGDLEYVGYSAMNYVTHLFFSGEPLEILGETQLQYVELLLKLKQEFQIYYSQLWRQLTLNLQGQAIDPCNLVGESFDETIILPRLQAAQNHQSLFGYYTNKLILNYMFQHYDQAVHYAELTEQYAGCGAGLMASAVYCFYYSLALLAHYEQVQPQIQSGYLQKVAANQRVMKRWADSAPMNYLHKYCLVEAERQRLLGGKAEAIELYDRAIELTRENHYPNEEALACELAAKFYLGWDKEVIACSYMTEAYYAYSRWGAKAKIDDLEQRYRQLLAPILQPQKRTFAATETLLLTSDRSSRSATSASGISDTLDLATLLKASQALSSEIELEKLFATLLQVVIENAGADKCVLLMPQGDHWGIEAILQTGETDGQAAHPPAILRSMPLQAGRDVPISLIQSVKHTLRPIVIWNASVHPTLIVDLYISQRQPKSLLCMPILSQGKLVGILYLENNLTSGAFTNDRVELLNLICAQAAISLENARLYHQAQHALTELQQAQLQIIQSEKMSALGNLVAGVAHEINNPIAFLAGNINPALNYTKDLFELIDLYQQKYPDSDQDIQAMIEEIDLSYVREDLPNLIKSMQTGVSRIREISTSLRTFSRADSDRPITCNLHAGIDSTLLILKHRLKANEIRPAIEVKTEYGQIPLIECYAGQLNQVFMNLLANAIDALEEASQGYSFAEIAARSNQITVRTELSSDAQSAIIRIKDNGTGMTEKMKQKAFDHLFTTKAVGKGTGLGLTIAYSIVVEKHQGTIEAHSTLGVGTEFVITIPVKAAIEGKD